MLENSIAVPSLLLITIKGVANFTRTIFISSVRAEHIALLLGKGISAMKFNQILVVHRKDHIGLVYHISRQEPGSVSCQSNAKIAGCHQAPGMCRHPQRCV